MEAFAPYIFTIICFAVLVWLINHMTFNIGSKTPSNGDFNYQVGALDRRISSTIRALERLESEAAKRMNKLEENLLVLSQRISDTKYDATVTMDRTKLLHADQATITNELASVRRRLSRMQECLDLVDETDAHGKKTMSLDNSKIFRRIIFLRNDIEQQERNHNTLDNRMYEMSKQLAALLKHMRLNIARGPDGGIKVMHDA